MDAGPLSALVIGEALVDIVDKAGHQTVHAGGSPANVALGLARLGVKVSLLSDLGHDDNGTLVSSHLTSSGVRILEGSYSDRPTSRAIATIGADGSASYEFELEWAPTLDDAPTDARVTHTGSIAVFLAPGGERVREFLLANTSQEVTLDPNIRPALLGSVAESRDIFEETAALATAVKLSDEDALWLYPTLSPDELLPRLLGLGPRLAVMTLGRSGSQLAVQGATVAVPSPEVRVVDTIGAGDTYMASLIASLLTTPTRELSEESLATMGRRAARAAAITVSRAGADLPTLLELGV